MARISDTIEVFIKELMEEYDQIIELQRNELATYFSCAPSQINYVLATRFSPEKGYIIESRRGGGGYIRLIRVNPDKQAHIMAIIEEQLGSGNVSEKEALTIVRNLQDKDMIDDKSAVLLGAVISDAAINIPSSIKNNIRASILKEAFLVLLQEE